MPAISMFYGIIIYMYFFDNQRHKLPHLHAEYAESEAVFSVEDGVILEGELPARQQKLVAAWIEIHRDELMANWRLAVSGKKVFSINPLV